MLSGQKVILGFTLFCSKTSEEMLEHTLLWKTSVQIPKLLRKLHFFLLWNSCTKRYAECLNLSGLILCLKKKTKTPKTTTPTYSTYSCEYFHEMYISFMASFLKPSHLNLKFSRKIVWFLVIKTSKNSESV